MSWKPGAVFPCYAACQSIATAKTRYAFSITPLACIWATVMQNPKGDPLGLVMHVGDETKKDTRVYETNLYLPYHTDRRTLSGCYVCAGRNLAA